MKITVSSDLGVISGQLSAVQKQVPFAMASAITTTAKSARGALASEIGQVFTGPTPWIKSGTFSTSATKESLQAWVGIKDTGTRASQAKYLKESIGSGQRGSKPMELAMRSMGLLPAGWLVVPSKDGVKKDAYGNVPKATIKRVLDAVRQKQIARKGADSYRVFVVRPGESNPRISHLAPGIWSSSRVGMQVILKPVFIFVQAAEYRKVLDLEKIVGGVVGQEFSSNFNGALQKAMSDAGR